ncbi:hypothetical protein NXW37_29625 [Bacteroides thetaiotaomicron]|nr:hypothetical protein [Bacteroides thetaiotaomicron]
MKCWTNIESFEPGHAYSFPTH